MILKRQKFRQINAKASTPTREREPIGRAKRSAFLQLTHGKKIINPIPYFGFVYRTVYANSIADYEGISTTSWSVGTTGGTNNFNCFYHHHTVSNQRTSTGEWIMNPIRWIVDVPTTSGSDYDHWRDPGDLISGFASDNRLDWRFENGSFNSQVGNVSSGALAFSSTWMTTNSHCDFKDNTARLSYYPWLKRGSTNRGSPSAWIESALQSIASSTPIMQNIDSCVTVDIALLKFRVNGSVIATEYENLGQTPGIGVLIPSVNKGDTIDFDIWYRIKKKAAPFNPTTSGKFVNYIQTTRVSNGSRRMWPYPNDNGLSNIDKGGTVPFISLFNVDMSPSFNRDLETYNVTFAGHIGWTLKDGSDGPHKIQTSGGWTKTSAAGSLKWTAPAGQAYCQSIELRYDSEIPRIVFECGSTLRTTTSTNFLFYRPANTGDYATSSVSKEYGNVNHPPSGVFDQAGTTTFNLVTWSQLPNMQDIYPFDGRRAGGFLPVYMEVPTTITLTKTTV